MITRRQFAQFSAAMPAALSTRGGLTDVDVVVAGAGAAGLAAARVLRDGGLSVHVFEAAPRIGGRCYTDTASFGMPFDQGALWLRNTDHNPLAAYANLLRFALSPRVEREKLYRQGRLASPEDHDAYETAIDHLSVQLAEACEAQDTDIAAGSVSISEPSGEISAWLPTAASQIGALSMGAELADLSLKDWFFREDEEPMRLVKQGIGTLVERLAVSMPVTTSAIVRRISINSRHEMRVETSKGSVRCKAVILSVSAGVLQAETIACDPGLPQNVLSQLNQLSMGALVRIGISLGALHPLMSVTQNSLLVPKTDDERGVELLVKPFGQPMAVLTAGGSLARDLEGMRPLDQKAFAISKLQEIAGQNAGRNIKQTVTTNWSRNPLSLGSVSIAKPGGWSAREALAEPIHESLFLTGEAFAGRAVQTVHGAYEAGRTTARRVLAMLRPRRKR